MTLLGIVTEGIESQLQKAPSPMLTMVFGITSEEKGELLKALFPMLETVHPSIWEGITKAVPPVLMVQPVISAVPSLNFLYVKVTWVGVVVVGGVVVEGFVVVGGICVPEEPPPWEAVVVGAVVVVGGVVVGTEGAPVVTSSVMVAGRVSTLPSVKVSV